MEPDLLWETAVLMSALGKIIGISGFELDKFPKSGDLRAKQLYVETLLTTVNRDTLLTALHRQLGEL